MSGVISLLCFFSRDIPNVVSVVWCFFSGVHHGVSLLCLIHSGASRRLSFINCLCCISFDLFDARPLLHKCVLRLIGFNAFDHEFILPSSLMAALHSVHWSPNHEGSFLQGSRHSRIDIFCAGASTFLYHLPTAQVRSRSEEYLSLIKHASNHFWSVSQDRFSSCHDWPPKRS